jgi:ParB-like chromosome segregation protein Spo0J
MRVQKAATTIRRLRLPQIRTNAGTQTRVLVDEAAVADYAEAMIAGDRFPPVVVFFDGRDYILADGFHRIRAARQARYETIQAEVRQGTRTDALQFSLASNHSHGLRRGSTFLCRRCDIKMYCHDPRDWSV